MCTAIFTLGHLPCLSLPFTILGLLPIINSLKKVVTIYNLVQMNV